MDERPFFRSYGAILPSSLTWFLSRTLVYSTHPPVSVCGTGQSDLRYASFSWSFGNQLRIGTNASARGLLPPPLPIDGLTTSRRHDISHGPGAGIFACCPSTTPFGLALGPDLPWEDEPGPGNLGFTVGGILTRLIVTHACMITRMRSTDGSRHPFDAHATLSYQDSPVWGSIFHDFGCPLKSRSFSARGHSASELLRNLQMVAASEPTSWLSMRPHILTIH